MDTDETQRAAIGKSAIDCYIKTEPINRPKPIK